MSDEQKKSEIVRESANSGGSVGKAVCAGKHLYNRFSLIDDKSGDSEDDELACV